MFQTKRDLLVRTMAWRCFLVILVLGLAATVLADEVSIAAKATRLLNEKSKSAPSEVVAKEEGADSTEEEDQTPPQIDKDVEEQDLDIADKDVKREDAEQFWDEAISDSPVLKQSEGDFLTYEEARDKGLLTDQPDDEPSEGKG